MSIIAEDRDNMDLETRHPLPMFTGKAGNWPVFRKKFEIYRQSSGLSRMSDSKQINTLMTMIGEDADSLLTSFNMRNDEKENYEAVYNKFDRYYTTRHNKIRARAKFNKLHQRIDENADDFIARVYTASELCEYPETVKEELIRDRLIVGVCDSTLSMELQLDPDITLETVLLRIREAQAESRFPLT